MNLTSPRGTFPSLLAALCGIVCASGCGAAPLPRTADERAADLGETRALEVIRAKLTQLTFRTTDDWDVDIGGEQPLRVDVRLGTGNFGIEYVTAQDRVDNAALPPRPRTRELQILPGANDDARAQVLLLDESSYRFDPHVEHVQAGETSAADAEGRLDRDVADFIEYVRGQ